MREPAHSRTAKPAVKRSVNSIQNFARACDEEAFGCIGTSIGSYGNTFRQCRDLGITFSCAKQSCSGNPGWCSPVRNCLLRFRKVGEGACMGHPIPGQPDESIFQLVTQTCPIRLHIWIEALYLNK